MPSFPETKLTPSLEIRSRKMVSKKGKKLLRLRLRNRYDEKLLSFSACFGKKKQSVETSLFPNGNLTLYLEAEENAQISFEDLRLETIEAKKNVMDMTQGSIVKIILLFALPIFLSQTFQTLYNTIDSLVVGHYLGDTALAAVSSSGNLIFLFTSFFIGTAQGAGVLISKFFGAKKFFDMSRAIHTQIAFGFLSGIILTILGVSLTPTLLQWMNTDPEVLPSSIAYFRYYFMGASAIILYNTFNGVLNAVGNSRRPLVYLIISSCMNVGLDFLFIGGFHLGVEWAAIATTISQFFSAFLGFIHLLRKKNVYHFEFANVSLYWDMVKGIFEYGMPSGVQNSVIGLANVFVQTNINAFGKVAMAGCGSYSKVEGFAFLPITSFTMAISTFIAQNLGAKQYDRAKKGARFGILCAMGIAEVIGILSYILSPYLIGLFSSSSDVVAMGVRDQRTICLFYFLLAFSHCIAAVCRGAGRAFVPMIIMLAVWCVFRVIYISLITQVTDDIVYIFWAYPITWGISSVIYLIYYLKSDWVHGYEKKKRIKK